MREGSARKLLSRPSAISSLRMAKSNALVVLTRSVLYSISCSRTFLLLTTRFSAIRSTVQSYETNSAYYENSLKKAAGAPEAGDFISILDALDEGG